MTRTVTVSTDRGVSDLIGFVLMFSIVAGSVSVIYLVGFDTLEQFSSGEDLQTADRAMRGVAETFEDIHRQGVPGRTLDVGVDGANLDLRSSHLLLRVNGSSGTKFEENVRTNALVIQQSDSEQAMVYESGALFRVGEAGSIVRHRPVFRCSDEAAILSVVRLRGSVSVSVDDPVQVTGRRVEAHRLHPAPGTSPKATNITIDVTASRYTDAWTNYFDRVGTNEQNWTEQSPGVYRCDADRVYVRQTTIEVETID